MSYKGFLPPPPPNKNLNPNKPKPKQSFLLFHHAGTHRSVTCNFEDKYQCGYTNEAGSFWNRKRANDPLNERADAPTTHDESTLGRPGDTCATWWLNYGELIERVNGYHRGKWPGRCGTYERPIYNIRNVRGMFIYKPERFSIRMSDT